jgi:hypothetical protein
MILKNGNKYHRFTLTPRYKEYFATPPLIPLFNHTPKQQLEFTVMCMKTGQIYKMYTWKSLANFVERKELEKQNAI